MIEPETNVMLPKSLLMDFNDTYNGNESELAAFKLLANKLSSDEDAPRLLANTLDDLLNLERRMAAIHMIEIDGPESSRFTLAMMSEFEELHEQSKPRVMNALLLSPQFSDPAVQRVSLMALNNEFNETEKQDLMRAMLSQRSLEPAIRSQIEYSVN